MVFLSACTSQSNEEPDPSSPTIPAIESTTTVVISAESDTTGSYAEDLEAQFGLVPVETVTPDSGGGTRPLLEWEPIDGAHMYSVVLLTPSGEAYWGWEGTATEVHVGGEPQLEEFAAGPSIVPGMSWSVAAYDDDFHVIAVSQRVLISP